MIESVSAKQIRNEVPISKTVQNRQYISMRQNDLEKSGETDSFTSKSKTRKNIATLAGIISAAAVVLGLTCLHKGGKVLEGKNATFMEKLEAGWKKLWGKKVKIKDNGNPSGADAKPKTEEAPKAETPQQNTTPKTEEKPVKTNAEPKAEVVQNKEEILKSLSNKKRVECTPDEIKQYADLIYPNNPDYAKLLRKCLESDLYRTSADKLETQVGPIKDFISVFTENIPKEFLKSDVLYKPIKDLKIKDAMTEDKVKILRNMENELRNLAEVPQNEIAYIDQIKDANLIETYKQSLESANNVFGNEFVEIFGVDISKIDTKKSILDINLEGYIKEISKTK